VGFVVDNVALGQVFSEYYGFSCQFSFHRLLHTLRLSSGAIDQLVADVPSGFSLTPAQETKKKKMVYVVTILLKHKSLSTLSELHMSYSPEWTGDCA
jgi:hypothetical protein